MNDKTPQYLSTAAAAQMLGLSTTLIQSLVDKNELQGWKTRGGHRRISLQSIHDYQTHARMSNNATSRSRDQPRIMVVCETPDILARLELHNAQWRFPVDLKFVDSVTEALLSLGSERPDLLVVELAMPRPQQLKTLQALENFNARGRPVSIVLVTQEAQLPDEPSGSSGLIQIAPGPLSEVWLHAYLTGVVARCQT